VNTILFLIELSLALIASFHLFQSDHFLHPVMVLEFGSAMAFSTMMVEKLELMIVVLQSYISPELV
jgi:succinylglutamate desuccinylase